MGGRKQKITGYNVHFSVKCNKKENFTLELANTLILSQMKYFLHYENIETVHLKILSHLCLANTV